MKQLILLIITINSLFAYITATYLTDGSNTLNYGNNNKIIIENKQIKQIIGFNNSVVDNNFKKISYITKDEFDDNVTVTTYNLNKNQILYYLLNNNDKIVYINNKKEKIIKFEKTIDSPIFGEIDTTCKKIKTSPFSTLITVCLYENIPVYIDYENKNSLTQIINKNVKKYINSKKTLKTTINKLNFQKEPITAKYIINKNGDISYLNAIYKLENSENGMFSISLKGTASFIYPTDSTILIKSYLIDLDDILFQIGGEEYVDNEKQSIWQEMPDSSEVPIVYKDENGKDKQITFIRNNKPLYDIGGVWYLVSWMNKKHKNNLLISFIDKGRIQGEIKKTKNNTFVFKAFTGNFIKLTYTFELDEYNKVIKVYNKNIDIKVQDITTPSILKNRKHLKDLFKNLHLKEINE